MSRSPGLRIACLAGAACLAAASAHAESALLLAYPESFGRVPAATYDATGQRLGGATLEVEKLDDGGVRLLSESGIEGGAHTIASAELEPAGDGESLRLRLQESRSFDPSGAALGVLRIDHTRAVATCTPPDGGDVDRLELPARDQIANVPFNLLFLPLVRGKAESLSFQFLLCSGGARFIDFEAHVARREKSSNGHGDLVEIRYGPRLGKLVSLLAQRLVPRLSFWFDPHETQPWLAHRLPLYARGPEVLVVRDGVSTDRLGDAVAN